MEIRGLFRVGRNPKVEQKGRIEWREYRLFDAETDEEIRLLYHGARVPQELALIEHEGHYVIIKAEKVSIFASGDVLYISPCASRMTIKG